MKNRDIYFYIKIAAICFVVALPILIPITYREFIKPNPKLTIAGGPPEGRYHEFVTSLADELNESSRLNQSTAISTGGSYENIKLLEEGTVQFALFQSGSDNFLDLKDEHRKIVFVSNVYPEVAHLLVRADISSERVEQLDFKKIAVGVKTSGDYRVGIALVSHMNLDRPGVDVQSFKYEELSNAFRNKEIELAILAVGIGAEVVQKLIDQGECRLTEVPMRDAFLAKHVAYSQFSIPRGSYYNGQEKIPDKGLMTVAVNAQLVAHKDVPSNVVGEMLTTLNHSRFLKKNRLRELFIAGKQYALRQPEFKLHPGAERYYDPSFRPLINPDFVEATEGIRSFVVSGLIGIFFLFRWMKLRAERSQDHKLDQYIHRVLAIDLEQSRLDKNYSDTEAEKMEQYLDEITDLRREALTEFSAHDMNDDPAIGCFISMTHALCEQINDKLSRDAIRKSQITENTEQGTEPGKPD